MEEKEGLEREEREEVAIRLEREYISRNDLEERITLTPLGSTVVRTPVPGRNNLKDDFGKNRSF